MEISEAWEFVRGRRNGLLATAKRDGRPQLSNITYAVIDGVIKISITAGRAKYSNLLRDPRAWHIGRTPYFVANGEHRAYRVAALELYPSDTYAPARYRTFGDACAMLLVWTRAHLRK